MAGTSDSLNGRKVSYEEAKELARSDDHAVRCELATRTDLKAEILYFLAEDDHPEVRRAAAANLALPRQADLLLARDQDETVREGLAAKIAKLAPGLSANEQDKLRMATYETLETLARDQMTRVRQILSDALKDVADAPPGVILRLARDAELVVAGPVLEYSPVLSDDDLLEIINSSPIPGAVGAIARRDGVSEQLSDAVVRTDDVAAIADLLANPSTQIREETLDSIIDQAEAIEPWHMPLVGRPSLPSGCARKLALYVADNLLDILSRREDLEPEALQLVRAVVEERLSEEKKTEDEEEDDEILERVRTLIAAGELDRKAIFEAMRQKKRRFVRAALAELGGIPGKAVAKAFAGHSAKGLVAVCWKAGLDPELAFDLQVLMGGIAPRDALESEDGQTWPLSEDELTWQVDFLSDLSAD